MKTLSILLIGMSLCTPLFAKKPEPIPKNASRKAVDNFTASIYKDAGELSAEKPQTGLPKPTLNLGKEWQPKWQVAKDGKSMIVRYVPQDDKRLEFGQVNIFVTASPFTAKLKDAPNVLDEGAAVEFEVQRWLPQKWRSFTIPSLENLKVRGYQDMQSGGADNQVYAIAPIAVKTASGQSYWVVVNAEYGYHKTRGMTLQRALSALKFE